MAPKRRPSKSTSRRWTLPSQQPSLVDVDLYIQLKNWLLPPRASRCYGHAAINKPRLTAISAKQDWLTNYGCAPTNAQPVPLWALHPRFPCVSGNASGAQCKSLPVQHAKIDAQLRCTPVDVHRIGSGTINIGW